MSIGVQCTACGRRYRVADEKEGSQIHCECGRDVRVEGHRYIDRICCVCGIDVSNLTRTRDAAGRYFCQPCWDEALRRKRAAEAAISEPELRWFTHQLSRVRFTRVLRPLALLTTLLLLVLAFYVHEAGIITFAALVVIGSAMIIICTTWMYVIPFRDGAAVGFRCVVSNKRRRYWAQRNPDFNLSRPASLALTGLWLVLLSLAFFAVAEAGRRYREQAAPARVQITVPHRFNA